MARLNLAGREERHLWQGSLQCEPPKTAAAAKYFRKMWQCNQVLRGQPYTCTEAKVAKTQTDPRLLGIYTECGEQRSQEFTIVGNGSPTIDSIWRENNPERLKTVHRGSKLLASIVDTQNMSHLKKIMASS